MIKRYNAPRGTTLSESDNGELVMAADHEAAIDALRTQVAELRAENAKLRQEQGDRQESFGFVLFGPDSVVDWTDDEEVAKGWADAEGYSYKACYDIPQPGPDVRQGDGDLTLTPAAQAVLTECIGAHAYVLQSLVNGRPDLALTEAKKWVDGFKQAADHHRQAQQGDSHDT